MALQLDRSLYSRTFNKETRAALDHVNEWSRTLPQEDQDEIASTTTLRSRLAWAKDRGYQER